MASRLSSGSFILQALSLLSFVFARLSFPAVPHVAQAGPHSVPSLWPPGAEITSLPVTSEGKNKATQCAWTHA